MTVRFKPKAPNVEMAAVKYDGTNAYLVQDWLLESIGVAGYCQVATPVVNRHIVLDPDRLPSLLIETVSDIAAPRWVRKFAVVEPGQWIVLKSGRDYEVLTQEEVDRLFEVVEE